MAVHNCVLPASHSGVCIPPSFDIWRDYDECRYPPETRAFHMCGCITVFDVEPWHSVFVHRCNEHKTVVEVTW